jgi:hypothetical protein
MRYIDLLTTHSKAFLNDLKGLQGHSAKTLTPPSSLKCHCCLHKLPHPRTQTSTDPVPAPTPGRNSSEPDWTESPSQTTQNPCPTSEPVNHLCCLDAIRHTMAVPSAAVPSAAVPSAGVPSAGVPFAAVPSADGFLCPFAATATSNRLAPTPSVATRSHLYIQPNLQPNGRA